MSELSTLRNLALSGIQFRPADVSSLVAQPVPKIVPDLSGAAAAQGNAGVLSAIGDTVAGLPQKAAEGVATGRKMGREGYLADLYKNTNEAAQAGDTQAQAALSDFDFTPQGVSYRPVWGQLRDTDLLAKKAAIESAASTKSLNEAKQLALVGGKQPVANPDAAVYQGLSGGEASPSPSGLISGGDPLISPPPLLSEDQVPVAKRTGPITPADLPLPSNDAPLAAVSDIDPSLSALGIPTPMPFANIGTDANKVDPEGGTLPVASLSQPSDPNAALGKLISTNGPKLGGKVYETPDAYIEINGSKRAITPKTSPTLTGVTKYSEAPSQDAKMLAIENKKLMDHGKTWEEIQVMTPEERSAILSQPLKPSATENALDRAVIARGGNPLGMDVAQKEEYLKNEVPLKPSERISAIKDIKQTYHESPSTIALFGKGQMPGIDTIKERLDAIKDEVKGDFAKMTPVQQRTFIFQFSKLNDPNSAVLLSEYKAAADTLGIWDKVGLAIDKAIQGQQITPEQARDIYQVIEQTHKRIKGNYINDAREILSEAKPLGINGTRIGLPKKALDWIESGGANTTGPRQPASGMIRVRTKDGDTGQIPASAWEAFLKDNPESEQF